MPLQIYMIRHGETDWSLSGQHTGLSDIALNKHGEQEALGLSEHLKGISFSNVWSSPLKRALRTCELAGLLPNRIEPDLVEWDYGDYEGRRTANIVRQHQGWRLFRDGCPHGESPIDVSKRADRIIEELLLLDGNVAIFTHGHFGRSLATRWIGLPIAAAENFQLGTASISLFGYAENHPETPAIVMWNYGASVIGQFRSAFTNTPSVSMKERALERWDNEGGEIPISSDNRVTSPEW